MAAPPVKTTVEAEDKATETFRRVTRSVKDFDTSLGASLRNLRTFGAVGGAITLGTVAAGIKSAISAIDDLDEAAQGLGITATALADLRIGAEQAGVGAEKFDLAITRLNEQIAEAAAGSPEAIRLFKLMGVEFRDSLTGQGRRADEVLAAVADRFRTYRGSVEKSALATQVLGERLGPKFVAFLNQGGDALKRNSGLTEENVEHSRQFQEQIDKLSASWERFKLVAGGAAAGVINRVLSAPNVNATEQVLARLEHRITTLQQQLSGRLNEDSRLAITTDLEEAQQRADQLRATLAQIGKVQTGTEDAPKVATPEELRAAEARKRFLDQLELETVRTREGEFAVKRRQAAELGFRGAQADAVERAIQNQEREKRIQEQLAHFAQVTAEEEQRRERRDDLVSAQHLEASRRLQDLQAEIDAIGQTRLAIEQLAAAREIDRAREERIRQTKDRDSATQSRIFADAEVQKIQVQAKIVERAIKDQDIALQALLRDIEFETQLIGLGNAERQQAVLLRQLEAGGIEKGTAAYDQLLPRIGAVKDALDFQEVIEKQQRLFGDLGRAGASAVEDLILNINDADDVLKTLEKSILRIVTNFLVTAPLETALTGYLKTLLGSTGSSGTYLGAGVAGLFGGNFSFARGIDYVPHDMVAQIHRGERVVPAAENQRGAAPNQRPINISVNVQPGQVTNATASQIASTVARQLRIAESRFR